MQYGQITITNGFVSNTAVINSVNIAKSVIGRLGQTTDVGNAVADSFARLAFESQTSVIAVRAGTAQQLVVRFYVKEYE